MAWWLKGHGYMKQLRRGQKADFPMGASLDPSLGLCRAVRLRRGQSISHLAADSLVKGGPLDFRVSLSHSSWCSKVGNTGGLSENEIIF